MGKKLIIAEKPSVATDLSKALAAPLGKFEKKGKDRNTYFESDQAVITSAVGHLVELRMPTGPNGKKLPWNFDVLPAIPSKFELEAKEKTESRLKLILKLARRKDVDSLVNACDAGREGELIFRYLVEYGDIKKPAERLWMQSMTRESILDSWQSLREDEQMQNLSDAAKCRSESDWLVGLNATRALTCFRSRHGGFNITAAGRVQTPTLAILAKREAEIRAFQSEPYCEVVATFDVQAGDYEGKWIDEAWKKNPERPHSRAERIWNPADAEAIRARCESKTGEVSETKKAQNKGVPQLYDLTTLQREAPFSAKQTLSIAQALYERHKMVTYPRTDSRYLPEDYFGTVRETVQTIAKGSDAVAPHAAKILREEPGSAKLHKSKRVFDSKKVSDHFAIIPTGKSVKLNDAEQKVYDMIVKRFLAVFYPAAEFEVTKRLTRITSEAAVDTFRTDGRILVKPGWMEVYGRQPGTKAGKDELVPVSEGESARNTAIEVRNEETKPPARFTESTLLSAMEGAGKLLDDEALAEAMAERGLGTPATRAAIIEGLLSQKYLARDGDGGRAPLHVTTRGMRLIEILNEMGTKGLTSPSLTGDWEYKLRQMEQGQLKRADFMHEIEDYTKDIVDRAEQHLVYLKNKEFPDLNAPCPKCGAATLKQTDVTYQCKTPDCGFKTKNHIASRLLSEEEAKTLFSTGMVGPLDGFKSRFNKPFDAALKVDEKFKIQFVFDRDEEEDNIVLNDDNLLETITAEDGSTIHIHQTEKAFILPEVKTKNNPEGARIGRTILQKELEPAQIVKMIRTGKTDLIQGFISKRTKRPFSAFLKWDNGKVGFEFEPRKPKAAKKTAAKKTATKS